MSRRGRCSTLRQGCVGIGIFANQRGITLLSVMILHCAVRNGSNIARSESGTISQCSIDLGTNRLTLSQRVWQISRSPRKEQVINVTVKEVALMLINSNCLKISVKLSLVPFSTERIDCSVIGRHVTNIS